MINIPILKKNFREHIWLWGIVTAVLVLYLFLLLGTYAPDGKAGVILLFSGLPSAVQTALGAGNYGLSLSGILGGYFWENIFTLVPFVVFCPSVTPVSFEVQCKELSFICKEHWLMSSMHGFWSVKSFCLLRFILLHLPCLHCFL